MSTYTAIEQFIGNGLGPIFGNSILFGGIFILLCFVAALALWNVGIVVSTLIVIGAILVLALNSNLIPINYAYLAILFAMLLFMNFLLKTMNER